MSSLNSLIAKLEAAEGPSRELDGDEMAVLEVAGRRGSVDFPYVTIDGVRLDPHRDALAERGLLNRRWHDHGVIKYEITPSGRAALKARSLSTTEANNV